MDVVWLIIMARARELSYYLFTIFRSLYFLCLLGHSQKSFSYKILMESSLRERNSSIEKREREREVTLHNRLAINTPNVASLSARN